MSNQNKQNISPDERLLSEIYKSVSMGSDSVTTIIGKTKDSTLRTALTSQLDGYQRFVNETKAKMNEKNIEVKNPGILSKMPSEISINMTTMIDNSTTKIAEMMINGSTMGVIEIKRTVNKTTGASEDCLKIADDYINFEESNITNMKNYL